MDKNDIIDYVMHTPHNTNKAVLSGMLNQLTEGGGSSDFSTAQVTFVKESGGAMNINMPYALDANPEQGNPDVAMSGINLLSVDTMVCNAILYKGYCFLDYSSYPIINIVITGSASKIHDGAILITGDCTITISE